MSKQTLDKSLMDVITDPDAGTPEDKMRLFIIYYICTPTVTDVSTNLLCITFVVFELEFYV